MLTGSFIAELLCIMEAIIRTLGSWPYLALSFSTTMTTPDLSFLPSSFQTFLSAVVMVHTCFMLTFTQYCAGIIQIQFQ